MEPVQIQKVIGKQTPVAKNFSHQCILAFVNTKVAAIAQSKKIRILDVGCGNGELIAFLSDCLPLLNPGLEFEFHGLDVTDSNVQAGGFFEGTVRMLLERQLDVDWRSRLSLIASTSPWPYDDGYFDIVMSNQVLEHVADHNRFFAETRRCMRDGGASFHLLPLIYYIQEGHIHIPLVHWIKRHVILQSYIRMMSPLSFGSYKEHREKYGMTLKHYAAEHADYMTFMTNYLTAGNLLSLCKRAGLRADFSFTTDFYRAKLRSMLRRSVLYTYRAPRPWRDLFDFCFLKRISSITLSLEKKQIYAR